MGGEELLRRQIARERAARKEAERLLEEKSRELFTANEQLSDMAELQRSIVETAADGILTYDETGELRSVNRAASRMFQCFLIPGMRIQDFFEWDDEVAHWLIPRDSGADESKRESEIDSLTAPSHEIVALRGTGDNFPAEVAVGRTHRQSTTIYTAIVRDLTRRKRLEQRLRQAQKLESVGRLAAGLAHEINTPIQFIGDNIRFFQDAANSFCDLLQNFEQVCGIAQALDGDHPELQTLVAQHRTADWEFLLDELPEAIAQSLQGVNTVASIITSMKEFATPKLEALETTDINRSLRNTIVMVSHRSRGRATIEADLDEALPPVAVHTAMINEVWLNLFDNALDAITTRSTAMAGLIRVRTRRAGDEIEVVIEDNGCGIPSDARDRIFDPFFTTKEVGQGVGQGLSFVHDTVVAKHGGSIQVQSELGVGTAMIVRIPIGAKMAEAVLSCA